MEQILSDDLNTLPDCIPSILVTIETIYAAQTNSFVHTDWTRFSTSVFYIAVVMTKGHLPRVARLTYSKLFAIHIRGSYSMTTTHTKGNTLDCIPANRDKLVE